MTIYAESGNKYWKRGSESKLVAIGCDHMGSALKNHTICPELMETNIVVIGDGEIKDKKEHEAKIPLAE